MKLDQRSVIWAELEVAFLLVLLMILSTDLDRFWFAIYIGC